MSARELRDFLKATAGDEEIKFIIPHPFLPPRYHGESQGRNLVAILDRDLTVHLRWENSRLGSWANITRGQFRRLAAESLRGMTKYRQDLKVFASFVDKVAELPFTDPIFDEPLSMLSNKDKASIGTQSEAVVNEATVEPAGGEPPLLETEW
jgi:hypothetical protein